MHFTNEELNAYIEQIDAKGSKYLKKVVPQIVKSLIQHPNNYQAFGVYWYHVKAIIQKYDDGEEWFYGDFFDQLIMEISDHGSDFRNIVAALVYADNSNYFSTPNHAYMWRDEPRNYILEDDDYLFQGDDSEFVKEAVESATSGTKVEEAVTTRKNQRDTHSGSRQIAKKTKKAFKLQDSYSFQGLNISIENKRGSTRSGGDPDGHQWSTKMKYDYGYIRSTKAKDGDCVDVYVNKIGRKSQKVFVVHQKKIKVVKEWKNGVCPNCGKIHSECNHAYDEDKVMLGFASKDEAVKAYLKQYDSKLFLGPVSTYSLKEFKKTLEKSFGKKLPNKIEEAVGHKEWIGVDLDGTLAIYDGWNDGKIGKPVKKMVDRVLKWIKAGKTVKIFTARAYDPSAIKDVQIWTKKNGLGELDVTNEKDPGMIQLWDDRVVRVKENTGEIDTNFVEESVSSRSEIVLICSDPIVTAELNKSVELISNFDEAKTIDDLLDSVSGLF
jgi:hypothetical protein